MQESNPVRTMSGMRPTGNLHLGHLFGTLAIWKPLTEQSEAFFEIADLHALTTRFREPHLVREMRSAMVTDWLAAGIDPNKAIIFLQSGIPEIAELFALLAMITPLAWLQRVPTYKDQIQALGADIATYGFLGYPLLQLCDVAIFKAIRVPVGRDQLAHLELGREIIRRFNSLYAAPERPILLEPQAELSEFPEVPGIDGRKMSKSYNNAIQLSDDAAQVQERVLAMITDPQKVRRNDPGRPEVCPVFALHALANPTELPEIEATCRSGERGCVMCKQQLARGINTVLEPIRERRAAIERSPSTVEDIIADGTKRARVIAQATIAEVKSAMALA